MDSQSSFYPQFPSRYPNPTIDPCPVFETTSSHYHGRHEIADIDYYRSRTMNDQTMTNILYAKPPRTGIYSTGIYARHGIGQYTLPYYRRDSKGFRKPYTQPAWVDSNYIRSSDYKASENLIKSGITWAHPSSKPVYALQSGQLGGPLLGTSYKNSGLYSSHLNHRPSKVHGGVYEGIKAKNYQHSTKKLSYYQPNNTGGAADYIPPSTAPASLNSINNNNNFSNSLTPTQPLTSLPPPPLDPIYETTINNNNNNNQLSATHRATFGDPLLADPIDNAYRKPNTVYQRAYGTSI